MNSKILLNLNEALKYVENRRENWKNKIIKIQSFSVIMCFFLFILPGFAPEKRIIF